MQSELNELNRTSKQSNSDIKRWKSVADEKERVVLQLRHQLENKSEQLKAKRGIICCNTVNELHRGNLLK